MTPAELLKPILAGGIRSVNFFNGRLLSGEDMSREQEANRETHRMLGRAIGDGIAYGFEVSRATGSGTAAVVTVQPGLAINRNGDALRLSSAINLSLVRPQNGNGPVDTGFSSCIPFQSGVYVSGSGVYLLTVSPARATEGRAPVSGLQNSAADCNTKYLVDGVQFRLIQLDLTAAELNDQNHLRNLVAYKCFGVQEAEGFPGDPFGPAVESYGLLDKLRPNRVTDCETPLAVLHWTAAGGLTFVDLWSVRRRITPPSPDRDWPLLTSDRRARETEAMFMQFQSQVEDLLASGVPLSQISARSRFGHLPPVGLLPVGASGSNNAFDYNSFFKQMTYRNPIFIEGAQVRSLFREALNYPPIDTNSEVVVWLYLVRENAQAALGSAKPTQAYLVFASGHTFYRGEAHYDVHHWNFGNFS
jgi:hypothetical protein